MKKIKVLSLLIVLTLIFSFAIYVKPVKAVSTSLSASSASVKSGQSFSVNVTSSVALSGWTVSLTSAGGCTFVSASGGEVSGKSVYGTSSSGTKSLATYKFKAPSVSKNTTYKITFSGTEMADATNAVNEVNNATCTATITVKANSTASSSSSSKGSSSSATKVTTPTFTTVNRKVYTNSTANLRSSWSTSSSATTVLKGTELTLTGTSTKAVNGYVWYRVQYNGTTKYVNKDLLTTTKPEEKTVSSNNDLSSLEIEGLTLTPSFSKDVLEYTATLEEEKDSLDVKATASASTASVKIQGKDNLKDGENTVQVVVTAENGKTKTYTVKVTKNVTSQENSASTGETQDDKLKLSSLNIAGVDFDGGFDPNKYFYELNLNIAVEKLDIEAKANREDATVEIVGNQDFVEGENLITILVTSESGEETTTYQIKVNMSADATQNQGTIRLYLILGLVIIALIVIVLIIVSIVKRRKNNDDDSGYVDESGDAVPTAKIEDNEEEDKEKVKRPRGRHSV